MTTPIKTTSKARPVDHVVQAHHQSEGAGFTVRRPLPTQGLELLDPFLLIDELGPMEHGPGEAVGAPDHPHRGFETVSYILEGEVKHEDSAGHEGLIKAGDVQWMTAGAGIIHSEMPSPHIQREGGRVHGFQIWVNLPQRDKMMTPRYQDISSAQIPEATTPDGLARVRVIAGEALGVEAVIDTRTPILFHHWVLEPGAQVALSTPEAFNLGIYVFEGEAVAGPQDGERPVPDGALAVLGSGTSVRFGATQRTQLLLLGGRPLNEPVARYGPFVMNTREELKQAVVDYQTGRFGTITRTATRS
ncbi:MAG: pirin family protein [Myxococcota bacterium]